MRPRPGPARRPARRASQHARNRVARCAPRRRSASAAKTASNRPRIVLESSRKDLGRISEGSLKDPASVPTGRPPPTLGGGRTAVGPLPAGPHPRVGARRHPRRHGQSDRVDRPRVVARDHPRRGAARSGVHRSAPPPDPAKHPLPDGPSPPRAGPACPPPPPRSPILPADGVLYLLKVEIIHPRLGCIWGRSW